MRTEAIAMSDECETDIDPVDPFFYDDFGAYQAKRSQAASPKTQFDIPRKNTWKDYALTLLWLVALPIALLVLYIWLAFYN